MDAIQVSPDAGRDASKGPDRPAAITFFNEPAAEFKVVAAK